ncbi:MAG: GNAT family N-acetyltransferase [Christensenellales bacterium]
MEKCGLNQEGVLKEYIKLSDGYHDMYMYALTRKDFKM